ncbi:hypothetical protein QFC21_005631 [Naganishia friedmannii]|uniref:Uncharacterized protein n=1 Tax=Naganishia friedmannii TaxID=89922 RepID=A0ACC2V8M7_9TREE|nr:hypothetical protein QFC21_005631 [Naganishia friedmannii]
MPNGSKCLPDSVGWYDMVSAIAQRSKSIGICGSASTTTDEEPYVAIAACGGFIIEEAVAAEASLPKYFPDIKILFVDIVDLFKTNLTASPTKVRFAFTANTPVIFNSDSYSLLALRFVYKNERGPTIATAETTTIRVSSTYLSSLPLRSGTVRSSLAVESSSSQTSLESRSYRSAINAFY